jgi:hypothetical protein
VNTQDAVEHVADLIMNKISNNIKAGNKLHEPVLVRECTFFNRRPHFGGRTMKRLLMTLILATVFIASSAQAANGKIYFADSAKFSITDDLDSPSLNVSFSPGYNGDDMLRYDMGWFRFDSVEFEEANEKSSPIDSDLTGLGLAGIEIDGGALDSAREEDLGYQFRVELGFNVSQTTVLTAEYRYLGIDEPNVLNPHGFVFGARFLY